MNQHARETVRCAEDLDVQAACRLWKEIFPHLPPPPDDATTLRFLHGARTQMDNMRFALRAYSHAWLTERGYPSMLPDRLRPKAERIYPVVRSTVGIAARNRLVPGSAGPIVQKAMEDAVHDADAEGRVEDTPFVRKRITEARMRIRMKLFGNRA
jgi:hypothetical protein